MKNNRIIIAGSRSCPESSDALFRIITVILNKLDFDDVEIVSGTCRGADIFGENFAKDMNLSVKQFPADWDKHGKSAGYIRNKEMAQYSTHLIAIWDGKSKGTESMIKLAKEFNLKIRIIKL